MEKKKVLWPYYGRKREIAERNMKATLTCPTKYIARLLVWWVVFISTMGGWGSGIVFNWRFYGFYTWCAAQNMTKRKIMPHTGTMCAQISILTREVDI